MLSLEANKVYLFKRSMGAHIFPIVSILWLFYQFQLFLTIVRTNLKKSSFLFPHLSMWNYYIGAVPTQIFQTWWVIFFLWMFFMDIVFKFEVYEDLLNFFLFNFFHHLFCWWRFKDKFEFVIALRNLLSQQQMKLVYKIILWHPKVTSKGKHKHLRVGDKKLNDIFNLISFHPALIKYTKWPHHRHPGYPASIMLSLTCCRIRQSIIALEPRSKSRFFISDKENTG